MNNSVYKLFTILKNKYLKKKEGISLQSQKTPKYTKNKTQTTKKTFVLLDHDGVLEDGHVNGSTSLRMDNLNTNYYHKMFVDRN